MSRVPVVLFFGLLSVAGFGYGQEPVESKRPTPPTLDGVNVVEGERTLLSILPEGSRVKKGDVVAELESWALRDELVTQQIATKRAEASLEEAQMHRTVAELAMREFVEGTYPQEERILAEDLRVAELETEVTRDELALAEKSPEQELALKRTRLAHLKAMLHHHRLSARLEALRKYGKPVGVKERQAAIERSVADELSARSTFERQQSRQKRLARQIDACTLRARTDGLVLYPRGPAPIEPGATVRERQIIFRILPSQDAPARP